MPTTVSKDKIEELCQLLCEYKSLNDASNVDLEELTGVKAWLIGQLIKTDKKGNFTYKRSISVDAYVKLIRGMGGEVVVQLDLSSEP